jgi:hypothetical protein
MTYRINTVASEQEAEAMVAADSFDAIVERLQRMVTAGRGMILAVREFTYLGRPPVLYGGLRLDTEAHGGGLQVDRRDNSHVSCTVRLTNGSGGFHDTCWFGFLEDVYQYSGNESEDIAWQRYQDHEAEHEDHFKRRRDMTHVAFTGGLPGWKYQHGDQIVITEWNKDGVATERTLGFEPAEGSW